MHQTIPHRYLAAGSVPLVTVFLLLFSVSACKRFEPEGFLHVNTGSVSAITVSSAQCGGEVTDDGGAAVKARGVCWSTSHNPVAAGNKTTDGTGTGTFTSMITGLSPGTTYYVRAYATNSEGTTYGEEQTFATAMPDLPTVTTAEVSAVNENSAHCGGVVTDDGGAEVIARGVCWNTSSAPTISGSKSSDGTGTGSFTSTLTGLNPNTTYYLRAYATNSAGTAYGDEVSFKTWEGSVSDYDGNFYPTIQIGSQTWMAENLKTTHYADGSAIPLVESATAWDALGTDGRAYCWYDNSISSRDTYGGLYTWAAAMNGAAGSDANPSGVQGVCPDGWHLPGDAEWKQLEMHLGMSQAEADNTGNRGTDEGGKLKEEGTSHWDSPNTGATNESGFTALPGGSRVHNGSFEIIGYYAVFWTATEYNATIAWDRTLGYNGANVIRNPNGNKGSGFSVRCIEGTGSSASLPTVTTTTITNVTTNSADGGGEVTYDGGAAVTARGVCWSTSTAPETTDSKTNDGTGTGTFISMITGLNPGTTYYVRAFATNSEGTAYGEEEIFTTKTESGTPVTDIDGNVYQTVQIGDQLWMAENLKTTRYANGSAIPLVEGTAAWDALTATSKAYCWYDNSTTNRDTYGGLYTWAAAMNGAASSDVNPSGVQGICPDGWHLPSDAEWTELTDNLGGSGVAGGRLKEAGFTHWDSPNTGATNESGFTALPGGDRNIDGVFNDAGILTSFWTATESNTSNAWDRYLNSISTQVLRYEDFKASGFSVRCVEGEGSSAALPTVTTATITDITETSAQGGGNVTDDGGAAVIVRGVCWSTSTGPDITDSKTEDGSGEGSYTSAITGLTCNTSYYVRAYATNGVGTAYGSQESFSTSECTAVIPTVTTSAVTDITSTSARGGGNVTDDGGATVTVRGVCWSTYPNPTDSHPRTSDGGGTGTYISDINGLTPGTLYYLRAYAKNSVGTGYGAQVTFITAPDNTLTDIDGNVYQTVQIGDQVWMAENLKTTRYANGSSIPLVEGASAWGALPASSKAYCWYDNSTANRDTYGGLYTWAAAMNGSASSSANPSGVQGVCPDGWHLPSDAEWTELTDYLGGSAVAGSKLREAGTAHWTSPNTGATNESGFTALPGGGRFIDGLFFTVGNNAYFWSATENDATSAWYRSMYYDLANVTRNNYFKGYGLSVRCLKD
jgi:uncharacterized protein (TIGR02145 family)